MRGSMAMTLGAFLAGAVAGGLAVGQIERSGEPRPASSDAPEPPSVTVAELRPRPPSAAGAAERDWQAGSTEHAAGGPQVSSQPPGATEIELGPMGLDEQVQVLLARWSELEARVERLNRRVGSLERLGPEEAFAADPGMGQEGDSQREVLPVDTPEERRTALVAVGVPAPQADDIVWRQSELALERLELQDRALREGWHRTQRYYEELSALGDAAPDLRDEIGEAGYDRYLYETGELNRVQISGVIEGSQAAQTGLRPGDVIESYDGTRIFRFEDLRQATTAGARDELVPLRIRRDGALIDAWVARGPIGVRLEAASVPPDDL